FSIGLITSTQDYLEIPWTPSLQYLILYQNNLKNIKLEDYLEKLADLLPNNINSKGLFVLLKIAIPYNTQVVSKSVQFDEFGN
ncbi:13984_t:CDS:2, partial [Cetraspora pellucida]